mmetsp:Transcript_60840/g.120433  ORF Transcript_60840/g.120433 Transcript_60840/m.120433 type:complete len:86 (+) Transcript_60840:176-433(+)
MPHSDRNRSRCSLSMPPRLGSIAMLCSGGTVLPTIISVPQPAERAGAAWKEGTYETLDKHQVRESKEGRVLGNRSPQINGSSTDV